MGTIPGFYHFACGDIFRQIDITSELGKVFYEYSSRGELVPDDITVKMWAESIHAHTILQDYKPRHDMLILDGIPRTVDQAEIMQKHIEVMRVIHLVCHNQEAMYERLRRRALKENRFDDADEKVIRNRWAVYQSQTHPILDYYPSNQVVEVDSVGAPALVLRDILDIVAPVQNEHFSAFDG